MQAMCNRSLENTANEMQRSWTVDKDTKSLGLFQELWKDSIIFEVPNVVQNLV